MRGDVAGFQNERVFRRYLSSLLWRRPSFQPHSGGGFRHIFKQRHYIGHSRAVDQRGLSDSRADLNLENAVASSGRDHVCGQS